MIMRVNGFDGQLSRGVISGILIKGCMHLEVYERCCVHESSGYMYDEQSDYQEYE